MELVVVIAILAVLSALLVPRIMGNVEDAKREREIADARTLASEIAVYNAKQKTETVPALITTSPLTAAALTGITDFSSWTSAEAFPESKYVTITIDAAGNPKVVEAPTPTP